MAARRTLAEKEADGRKVDARGLVVAPLADGARLARIVERAGVGIGVELFDEELARGERVDVRAQLQEELAEGGVDQLGEVAQDGGSLVGVTRVADVRRADVVKGELAILSEGRASIKWLGERAGALTLVLILASFGSVSQSAAISSPVTLLFMQRQCSGV